MTTGQDSGHAVDDGMHVSALGTVVRLVFDPLGDDVLRSTVMDAWAGAQEKPTKDAITVGVLPGSTIQYAMETLSTRVTLAALESQQGKMLLFHAAGIALNDGRVIAFVGPSGRGKTTLASVLGARYGYVSDESIAVDSSLAVEPYRKPLSVVQDQGPKRQLSPAAAGLLDLPVAPLRLAAVVLLARDTDEPGVKIERVPLLEAIAELIPETSFTASLVSPLQMLASMCEQVGGVQRMTYGDAKSVPDAIDALLQQQRRSECWQPANEAAEAGGALRAATIGDAIRCSGEVAIFSDQRYRVLGGIGPTIWDAAKSGKTFDMIVEHVVDAHGIPTEGDPEAMVAGAIDALVHDGVLQRCY